VIIAIYIFVAGFTLWKYFQRESPATNINRLFYKDPEGFNLTKDSLPFAFGLQDSSNYYVNYVDPTIYRATAEYVIIEKNVVDGNLIVNRTKIPIPLTTCDKVELNKTLFDNLNLSGMYCIENYSANGNPLHITGVFESDRYGYVEINLYRCTGPTCQSKEAIDKKLLGAYFAANYINRVTKTSVYENPIEVFPVSYYTPISNFYKRENILYTADNDVLTLSPIVSYLPPTGIRFTSVSSMKTDITELTIEKDSPRENFYNMVIRMDTMRTVTERSYQTALDSLAEYGGLVQIITFIGFVLTHRTKKIELLSS
jgi:hypothetical protein